jgi:competence protein ComEC
MPALSIALLAFAAGATLLQWQPVLPSIAPWFAAAGVSAVGAIALHRLASSSRIATTRRAPFSALFIGTLIVATAGTFGFGYAAWRAETRLTDELPTEWEGVDIAVVGVIDELPQSSARGTRFAFAVERIDTPDAIVPARLSLAWYAQWKVFNRTGITHLISIK